MARAGEIVKVAEIVRPEAGTGRLLRIGRQGESDQRVGIVLQEGIVREVEALEVEAAVVDSGPDKWWRP